MRIIERRRRTRLSVWVLIFNIKSRTFGLHFVPEIFLAVGVSRKEYLGTA